MESSRPPANLEASRRSLRQEWLTPPNLLTLLRIALTPLVAIAILKGQHRAALALVVVAGVTDGADGFLARHFGWKSNLGAYLDPIADKLLLVVVYGAMTVAGFAPPWLFVLILVRDAWILSMVAFAWFRTPIRDFPPRLAGKASTAAQIALAATLLVGNAFPDWIPDFAGWVLTLLVAAMAVLSGSDYTLVALRRYKKWNYGQERSASI